MGHPMLAIPEKAKLLNCDRPCAEEEWSASPLDIKWGTLEILKFAYRGEKKVKLEGDTTKVAPAGAKPPPPERRHPRTVGIGLRKRSGAGKGKYPTGKSRKGKGASEGGKTLTKVGEMNRSAESHYSSMTAREEERRGPSNHQREQSYQNSQWRNTNGWEWNDGGWKWKSNSAKTNEDDARKLGFGEYADRTYAEVIANRRGYAHGLLGETDIQCPEQKRFAEWARWGEDGIITDANTVEVECEAGNMPTVGEEF